jgi:hypothetical protein
MHGHLTDIVNILLLPSILYDPADLVRHPVHHFRLLVLIFPYASITLTKPTSYRKGDNAPQGK